MTTSNEPRYVKPGTNSIHFQARKEAGERISASPADVFELMLGDGDLNKGQLMLNKTGSYRRSAAEHRYKLAPVAVGTRVASRPPHGSVRAAFPHTALTSGPNGKYLPYAVQRL